MYTQEELPSPCGVLVLKLRKRAQNVKENHRFRPLAGFWFLNWRKRRIIMNPIITSVPLRGSGS